jgi:hypothetical protein
LTVATLAFGMLRVGSVHNVVPRKVTQNVSRFFIFVERSSTKERTRQPPPKKRKNCQHCEGKRERSFFQTMGNVKHAIDFKFL